MSLLRTALKGSVREVGRSPYLLPVGRGKGSLVVSQ